MTPPKKGKDEVRKWMAMLANDFADNQFTIEEVIVSGDRVVVRNWWSATVKGDFFGIKAAGKKLSVPAVQVLRIKNGKVVENISYSDTYAMFQQLGALPPPDQLMPQEAKRAPQIQPNPTD